MSNSFSDVKSLQELFELLAPSLSGWSSYYGQQMVQELENSTLRIDANHLAFLSDILKLVNHSDLRNLVLPFIELTYNAVPNDYLWQSWIDSGDDNIKAKIDAVNIPFYPAGGLYFLLETPRDTPKWERFLEALRHLEGAPWAVGEICKKWVATRDPDLEALIAEKGWTTYQPLKAYILTQLLTGQTQTVWTMGTREIKILLEACQDSNPLIAERAIKSFKNIPEADLAKLAKFWPNSRAPFLLDLFIERNFLPAKPLEVRVLVALKRDDWQTRLKVTAREVPFLVQALDYGDQLITERATSLLAQLNDHKAQEVLCRYVIEHDAPRATAIATAKGYLPAQTTDKALFYFITGQWDKYEAIDFDQRILRSVYATAGASLRRRLAAKVREAGRVEYLMAIAGSDYRIRTVDVNLEEAELLVQILAASREWSRLWLLVFDLPLAWSVEAVRLLAQNGWQPTKPTEREVWEQLKPLAFSPILTGDAEINQAFAPAYLRARIGVPGRVNDIAFAPAHSQLALATSTAKVILWNMQKAKTEKTLNNFAHSIGRVTFTPDSTLICGERGASNDEVCRIYSWQAGAPCRLGEYNGSITALESTTADEFISAARDGQVNLWDAREQKVLRKLSLPNFYSYEGVWARGLCLSPTREQGLLLQQKWAVQIKLPELETVNSISLKGGVPQFAAYASDGKSVVVAQTKGRLTRFAFDTKGRLSAVVEKFGNYSLLPQMQGLVSLPELNLLVIATADGQVSFNDWSNCQITGKIEAPGKRLTSLKVSPDGYFMAVGDSDASFSLWDLRSLELRLLLKEPLAKAKAVHLAALRLVRENEPELTPALATTLQFVELVLRERFRYDIELAEELPSIQAGQFDIEIEG